MTLYIDASAAAKLVLDEPESDALRSYLDEPIATGAVYSAVLLETELRRAATREGLDQALISRLLERISLLTIPRSVFTTAGLLPQRGLRSLDALHVATAIDAEADVLVTYDHRMIEACAMVAVPTASPS